MIRSLAKIGHVDVVSFVDNTISNLSNVEVIYSHNIDKAQRKSGLFEKAINLFIKRNQYAIYPENKQKSIILERIIKRANYDYIVVRYFYYACDCGLIKYSNRLLLDIDDDPRDVVLMSLDKIKTPLKRFYYRMYANTVSRVTKYAMKNVFKAFYSSPGREYPNALFLPNISVIGDKCITKDVSKLPHKILIVSWFRYYPNIEGLNHFIAHVFPIIKEHICDVELDVVGKMDDEKLKQLCHETEGVNLKGFVADLTEAYAGCKCRYH